MNSIKPQLCQENNVDYDEIPEIQAASKTDLVPDLDQSRQWINEILGGGHQIHRAFHDKKESRELFYPEGEFEDVKEEFTRLIKKGFGIFTVVNGKNYKKVSKGVTLADEDITEIQCNWLDLDEAPLQPVLDVGFTPHAIIRSSNTLEGGERFQVYWKVSDCPVGRFEEIQKKIAKRFNGDTTVCNPSRVMRTPGTLHQKYTPCLSEIIEINRELPAYSLNQIINGLGLDSQSAPKKISQKKGSQTKSPKGKSEHRNDTLCSLAGNLEANNRTYDEILSRCQAENTLFKEPVDSRKIMEVVNWIWKKRQERVERLNALFENLKNLESGTPRVEAIQNNETKDLLRLAQDTDPTMWSGIEDLFKSKQKLTFLKNAVRRGPALTLAGTTDNLRLSEIPGCPKEYPGTFDCYPTVPGYKFQQNDRGVKVFKDGSEYPEEVCHTPVFLTKRLIKDGGDIDVEAAWLERGRWRYLEAPRSSFFNANRILDLGDKGFPVGSANNRLLARYLQVFESIHISLIPEKNVSSQMGWKGKSFLLGHEYISKCDEDATPIEFHGLDGGEESLVGGIRQRGDYNKWVKAVESVQHYTLPMSILYASFAAPLLKILEQSSFGVDISNRTSTAKTISLRLSASLWGQPDEHNSPSVTRTWDNTNVAVERLCSAMCDLPVILDDTKRQKTEKISDNLYTITHGQGRGRGSKTGIQITRSWRVVLLSSGEAAAVSYTHNAGVRARILSLRGAPFGADNQETRKLVNNLNDTIKHNYGHAGPMFVKWLVNNHDRWPEFRNKLRDNIATLTANTGVSSRLADMAAVITTAGQLVHEALNLPWAFTDPISKVWPQLLKDSKDADICDRALVVFGDYVASHPDRFFNKHKENDSKTFTPFAGWCGRCDDSIIKPWTHIDFIPARLKDICKSEGLDYEAVVQGLKDKKLAKITSDRINGCVLTVLRISKNVIEGDQSGGCGICARNDGCEKEPCEWDSWADRCAMFVEDTAKCL